jgi:acyl-ACP thioesterase
VVYSDIDFNDHVNSMKYLEWMVDTLMADPAGGETFRTGGAVRMDINYLHEAKLGASLEICCGADASGSHCFDIRNAEGVSICKAAMGQISPKP